MFPGAWLFCRLTVWPSGLATGYLWTTLSVQRSLLASRVTYRNFPTSDDDNSRQNRQIRREIRKKIFRDNFFSDENLSESVQNFFLPWPESLRALGLDLSNEVHVTCLGQWESTSDEIGVWDARAARATVSFSGKTAFTDTSYDHLVGSI